MVRTTDMFDKFSAVMLLWLLICEHENVSFLFFHQRMLKCACQQDSSQWYLTQK